jgi:hypothetical protein
VDLGNPKDRLESLFAAEIKSIARDPDAAKEIELFSRVEKLRVAHRTLVFSGATRMPMFDSRRCSLICVRQRSKALAGC